MAVNFSGKLILPPPTKFSVSGGNKSPCPSLFAILISFFEDKNYYSRLANTGVQVKYYEDSIRIRDTAIGEDVNAGITCPYKRHAPGHKVKPEKRCYTPNLKDSIIIEYLKIY